MQQYVADFMTSEARFRYYPLCPSTVQNPKLDSIVNAETGVHDQQRFNGWFVNSILWRRSRIMIWTVDEREADALTLSSQLSASLVLIQGIALNHNPTKVWLGRKYPLEVSI